jgi:hypothetical protein
MQTISSIYGPNRSQELWCAIADAIDPELKNEIFMTMLVGHYQSDKIKITNPYHGPLSNKVAVVRAVRKYDKRRLNLREAMNIADSLADAGTSTVEVEYQVQSDARAEFRQLGLVI